MNVSRLRRREFLGHLAALAVLSGCKFAPLGEKRWYRGVLHCHSVWSDGHAFPEEVVDWYKSHGYNFLGLSDHNLFQDDPALWVPVTDKFDRKRPTRAMFDRYVASHPDAETRKGKDGGLEVRLRTYAELAARSRVPGSFELYPAVELTHGTDLANGIHHEVHMNLVNVPAVPPSYTAKDFVRTFKGRSIDSLIAGKRADSAALAVANGVERHLFVLNHPIWRWYDVGPEALIENPDVRFFEVCNNGSTLGVGEGLPADGLDTDRFWDVVNAFRARRGQPLLYGVGNDDTHFYFESGKRMLMPGNAWSRVRALSPAADDVLAAMDAGDFTACEGLEAEDVVFDRASGTLTVSVAAEPAVARKITFIVSKADFDECPVRTVTVTHPDEKVRERRVNVYSDGIGKIVRTVIGKPGEPLTASYALVADDLYVRARIESPGTPLCRADLHPKCFCCWTQPYTK